MSYSFAPIQTIKSADPRIILDNPRAYTITVSAQESSQKVITSNDVSTASISWTCTPPNINSILERRVYMSIPIRVYITGTANAGYTLLQNGKISLRAMPLSSIINKVTVNYNDCSVTSESATVCHIMSRFNDSDEQKLFDSGCPNGLDQSANYEDLFGTNLNPLGCHAEGLNGRAGFSKWYVVSNPVSPANGSQLVAIIDCIVIEPLKISPLTWGPKIRSGMSNLNGFDIQITFVNSFGNRLLSMSRDPTYNITSTNVELSNFNPTFHFSQTQPQIYLTFLTQNMINHNVGLSNQLIYDYYQVQKFSTDVGSINYGSSALITTNNVSLTTIPKRVIFCVRNADNVLNSSPYWTDTYMAIENVSLLFNNRPALFSQASQFQNWNMARQNGLTVDWSDFNGDPRYKVSDPIFAGGSNMYGGIGSIVCYEFGTDICLNPDESVSIGASGSYNIQASLQVRNTDPSLAHNNTPMSIVMIVIYSGIFIATEGHCATQLSLLSRQDVITSPGNMISNNMSNTINGGFFGQTIDWEGVRDTLGNAWNKANEFGETVYDLVSGTRDALISGNEYLQREKPISSSLDLYNKIPGVPFKQYTVPAGLAAKTLGYGSRPKPRPKSKKRKARGGELVGGASIKKSSLKKRARV